MRTLTILVTLLTLSACAGPAPIPPPPLDPAVAFANRKDTQTYREGFIGEGENRIHYVETGDGPPVLMVHGFPSFWFVWFRQMEAFGACRRMIAIDAPGANLSGRPSKAGAYRVEALAHQLDTVIATLVPDGKVTLVGHDWGGALAWSYAEWKPDRLDRLAVFSAPPYDLFIEMLATDPLQRKASSYVPRLNALDRKTIELSGVPQSLFEIAYGKQIAGGILSAAEGEVFRAGVANPDAIDAGIAWYRANIPPFEKVDPALAWPSPNARTGIPVLLVQGSEDRTFAATLGERAGKHADDLTLVTLEGVGHWTPFEDKEAANRALGKFLGLPEGRCPSGATSTRSIGSDRATVPTGSRPDARPYDAKAEKSR